MTERLNIFTCCDGLYNEFIPIFIFSHLYHNKDSFVEVGYDGHLSTDVSTSINYLESIYKNRFLVRECKIGQIRRNENIIKCSPNLSRFIIEPSIKSEYIYISDVDIICLQNNIIDIHIEDMKKNHLPYSNIVRKKINDAQKVFRLTGLHFTKSKDYYPLPSYEDLIELGYHNHDEVFLYELVKKKFPIFNYENQFRPVHGIHVSLNRQPKGNPGWGIQNWINQWKIFRKVETFMKLEESLPNSVKEKIKLIDIITNE